jgi:hypothetical protein
MWPFPPTATPRLSDNCSEGLWRELRYFNLRYYLFRVRLHFLCPSARLACIVLNGHVCTAAGFDAARAEKIAHHGQLVVDCCIAACATSFEFSSWLQALEPQDFYDMTLELCAAVAGQEGGGRVVSVLEGGCVAMHLHAVCTSFKSDAAAQVSFKKESSSQKRHRRWFEEIEGSAFER